jgi:Transposase DDE domain group 1
MVNQSRPHLFRDLNANSAISLQNDFAFNSGARGESLWAALVRDFAGCFVDHRDQRYVEHTVQELVSQRIHGLVLGYEDLNDHDHLRRDPVHGLICGKNDPLGQDRILERDKGNDLAPKTRTGSCSILVTFG